MRKFLLTLLCLVLISCSSGATEESVSETQEEQTTTTESTTTTSTTTTTTVYEEPPFAIDEFGLEIQEPPTEIKEQLVELMKFIERRIGLEFIEEPLYDFYTLNDYQEYNALSFLDDFEEDYEEGEWERAVLSERTCGV